MARVTILVLALLLAPGAFAQLPVPTPSVPDVVGPPANQAVTTVTPILENETGEELSQEDIDVSLVVNVTNAEFQVGGILTGGGKVQMDLNVLAHLEFRAVAVSRLDAAMQERTGERNVSLSNSLGLDTNRSVLTAEEVRAAGGGALLEAFQRHQEDAAGSLLQGVLPGLAVISTSFEWSNTVPRDPEVDPAAPQETQPPRLTEPPIVLDVEISMRYVDRVALLDLLADYQREKQLEAQQGKSPRELLQERIKENQTVPPLERSAFSIMAIDQLLAFNVEPGWRLRLTLTVPKGFTIEGATDELVLSEDRRSVTYFADGGQATVAVESAGVASLSSRPTVVTWLLVLTAGVGLLLRAVVETVARHARRRPPGSA